MRRSPTDQQNLDLPWINVPASPPVLNSLIVNVDVWFRQKRDEAFNNAKFQRGVSGIFRPARTPQIKYYPFGMEFFVRWPRQTAWEYASSQPNVPAYRQRPRKPPGANRDLTLPCQPTFNTNFPKFSPLNNIANTSGNRSIPSSTCSLETSLPARIHCPISTAASLYRAA